jgi:hypothetical protein
MVGMDAKAEKAPSNGRLMDGEELNCVASVEALRRWGQARVPALWIWETGSVLIEAERPGRITSAAIRTFPDLLNTLSGDNRATMAGNRKAPRRSLGCPE